MFLDDSGQPLLDTIHHCDALDLLRALPDGCIDAIIADPPYGIGIDEWDKPIDDIPTFTKECARVLKPTGFYVFFGLMPTVIDWINAAQASELKYKDKIVWVKRVITGIACDLVRSHEDFYIYRKSEAQYYKTEGKYTDVKLPGIYFDTVSIEALDRYIKDLHLKANGKTPSGNGLGDNRHDVYQYMKVPSDRSPEWANFTNVWSFLPHTQHTKNGAGEHPTIKPLALMKRIVKLTTPPSGIILDPFIGSGSTALAATQLERHYIGCDISAEYVALANRRLAMPYTPLMFVE